MNWIVIILSVVGAFSILTGLLYLAWLLIRPVVREKDPRLKDWANRKGLK